jgi:hypothetical protein
VKKLARQARANNRLLHRVLGKANPKATASKELRLEGLLEELSQAVDDARWRHDALVVQVQQLATDLPRQIEAQRQLAQLNPRVVEESSSGGGLAPSTCLTILSHLALAKPGLVVELGAGSTTTHVAQLCARQGGRLVSVHQDSVVLNWLRRDLKDQPVELRQVSMTWEQLDGQAYVWYNPTELTDLKAIDALVVASPTAEYGPQGTYPALPLLHNQLADNAFVFLDTTTLTSSDAVVKRWLEQFAGLTVISRSPSLTVLRWAHTSAG